MRKKNKGYMEGSELSPVRLVRRKITKGLSAS